MFSKKDFQEWGKKDVVLFASIMTRIDGRKDDNLLSTYGFRGFPSFALLDGEGEAVTKKVGRELGAMQRVTADATEYVNLKNAKDAGKKVDANRWFLARLGMGEVKLDDARKEMKDLKLDAKQTARAKSILVGMEVDGIFNDLRSGGTTEAEAGKKLHAMYSQGGRLPKGHQMTLGFNVLLNKAAYEAKDHAAFMATMPEVQKYYQSQKDRMEKFANDPRYKDNERAQQQIKAGIERFGGELKKLHQQADELKKAKEAGK